MLHTSSCRCGLIQAGYSPDRSFLTEKVTGVSAQPQGPVSYDTLEKCCSENSTRAKQLGSEGMWLPLLAAVIVHQLNFNIKSKPDSGHDQLGWLCSMLTAPVFWGMSSGDNQTWKVTALSGWVYYLISALLVQIYAAHLRIKSLGWK